MDVIRFKFCSFARDLCREGEKMQIKQEICIDSLWAKRQEFYFQ